MSILKLPDEVLQLIISPLSNRDVKNVRLTNRRLASNSKLRIERVFISPSYRNIEVFRAVATHDEFRNQVKEIIWDDAKFRPHFYDEELNPEGWSHDEMGEEFQMRTFEEECNENIGHDPEGGMEIYEEQEGIIKAGLDVEAFREGLSAFSSLKRVTVTSEAHRRLVYAPRYPTPMIRSFPPSFNYPLLWPWWGEHYEYDAEASWGEIRDEWRGFYIVLDVLANHDRRISELIIDVNYEKTGIAYQFFETESEDFTNFETICGHGLKRLDLAINVINVAPHQYHPGLAVLPIGPLRRALSKATSLEHFSIHSSSPAEYAKHDAGWQGLQVHAEVLKLLPTEHWPNLRHLTLSSLLLKPGDAIAFLKRLPATVKSLELNGILLEGETRAQFLHSMRDELQWTSHHPEVTMASLIVYNRRVWLREEIARFLDGGDNPFYRDERSTDIVKRGFGVLKDDFDDEFEEAY